MKKVILVPDSFKGTMTSIEFCEIARGVILRHNRNAEVVSIPVADGGEGSVDSFLSAVGGNRIEITVKGPYMEDVESFYGIIDGGATAVIEMAACAGLPLVGGDLSPDRATTFGVGQMIADAVSRGCKKIIMGLGGSATNDFGAGAAAALGIRFLDGDGVPFTPVGGTLSRIAKIDRSTVMPGLDEIEFTVMCDIDTPLYGPNGAACVFSPQKGADAEMVKFLDGQLRAVSEAVKRDFGVDVSEMPGSGAAGGMGGGMAAFFGSTPQPGIEIVLDTAGFDGLMDGADMVISGEGRIDQQSLRGKVVIGVARRAKKYGVPVLAVVGDIGDGVDSAYDEGVSAIFSINRRAMPFEEAKPRAKSDLRDTLEDLMRLISCVRRS